MIETLLTTLSVNDFQRLHIKNTSSSDFLAFWKLPIQMAAKKLQIHFLCILSWKNLLTRFKLQLIFIFSILDKEQKTT